MSGTLPNGWRQVKFGDVVRKVNDKVDPETAGIERYIAGEHMGTDDLRIRTWGKVGEGYLGPAFHMRFRPGQVLYGSRRTYLRKVALADFDGICANTTFVLESATSELLPAYLPYVMTAEAFHEHSIQQSKGSVNPYINYSDLTWYEFALPPISEQTRIVDVMKALGANVERVLDVERSAQRLRTSLVAPDGSVELPLGELLLSCDYGISVAASEAGEVPILRMNNIDAFGELDFSHLKFLEADEVEQADMVEPGDILFNRTNSLEHVGKLAIVEELPARTAYASYLLRLRVDPKLADPDFVCLFLQSHVGQQRIRSFVSLGVSQANVNATNLKRVMIPVPELERQRQIAAIWKSCRRVRRSALAHRVSAGNMRSVLGELLLIGAGR